MSPNNKSAKKKARWSKNHPTAFQGEKDDIVVVVMGQTGVGKSTFIHHLLGGHGVKRDTRVGQVGLPAIGEDLESCTVELEPFVIEVRSRRLVVVDTPGFDDTFVADSEILERIAVWLASSYSKDMRLGGVIYLHDMSQPRMLGTTRKNFEMFEVLCGADAAKAIVLGMTKSEELQGEVRRKREEQLRQKFWELMINRGAKMARFEKTSESAWKILNSIVGSKIGENPNDFTAHPLILQIQNELVELEKILPSTTAGKKLRYTLEEVLQMQKNSAKALKSQSGGQAPSTELKAKLDLIESLANQISQLSVPSGLWQRIKTTFFTSKE